MAQPPVWMHAIFGFLATLGLFFFTWLLSWALRTLKRPEEPVHHCPHVVSICYDPERDLTTLQYSDGEQLFLPGPPASFAGTANVARCETPGEPLTTEALRGLACGDGAAEHPVRFNQEGGYSAN